MHWGHGKAAVFFLAFASSALACGTSSSGPAPDTSIDAGDDAPEGSASNEASTDAAAACPAEDNVVGVTGGCIRGAVVTGGVLHQFLGVPFAAPPTGDLRWKPPAPPVPWPDVRDTNAVSKACPQIAELLTGKKLEWDEDCLYLNAWTPSLEPSAKLPVMVWIHGGGLVNGSGNEPVYAGTHMADQGQVVAVTINYRLGQLGYLGHPKLADEQGGKSGNYGLLDQVAALEWVKANIARLGGDPANVTVYGESAGALSTCALLASPRAAGLFHRAVMESGGCPGYGTYVRPEKTAGGTEGTEEQGVRYAAALGCDVAEGTLGCMRSKTPEEVLAALPAVVGVLSMGERYGFTVDGDVLPDTPDARTAAGAYNRVPTVVGTNADEGTIFVAPLPISGDLAYSLYVHSVFPGAKGDAVLAQYPSASYATPKAALAALVTDLIFACPARRKARDFARYVPDVYLYQFAQVPSYAAALTIGAFHGSEIDFVMGTLRERTAGAATADELALSDAMLGYWSRFAKSGDPNGGAVAWSKYDPSGDKSLSLASPVVEMAALKKGKCDFLDSL